MRLPKGGEAIRSPRAADRPGPSAPSATTKAREFRARRVWQMDLNPLNGMKIVCVQRLRAELTPVPTGGRKHRLPNGTHQRSDVATFCDAADRLVSSGETRPLGCDSPRVW